MADDLEVDVDSIISRLLDGELVGPGLLEHSLLAGCIKRLSVL